MGRIQIIRALVQASLCDDVGLFANVADKAIHLDPPLSINDCVRSIGTTQRARQSILHVIAFHNAVGILKTILKEEKAVESTTRFCRDIVWDDTDGCGWTCAHYACFVKNHDILKLLFERSSATFQDYGVELLHLACTSMDWFPPDFSIHPVSTYQRVIRNDHCSSDKVLNDVLGIVSLLLGLPGVSANSCDSRGNCPLHKVLYSRRTVAGFHGRFLSSSSPHAYEKAILTLLLDKGADINCQDNDGFTALALAVKNGYEDICLFLVERGANPCVGSCRNGSWVGRPCTWASSCGKSALVVSMRSTSTRILNCFLRSEFVDVNDGYGHFDKTLFSIGMTCRTTEPMMRQLVLAPGVNMNALCGTGAWAQTPLDIAIRSERYDLVKLFAAVGGRMYVKSRNRTALQLMSSEPKSIIGKMILCHMKRLYNNDLPEFVVGMPGIGAPRRRSSSETGCWLLNEPPSSRWKRIIELEPTLPVEDCRVLRENGIICAEQCIGHLSDVWKEVRLIRERDCCCIVPCGEKQCRSRIKHSDEYCDMTREWIRGFRPTTFCKLKASDKNIIKTVLHCAEYRCGTSLKNHCNLYLPSELWLLILSFAL